jgi:GMP synthase-like glutamine amidotransferase
MRQFALRNFEGLDSRRMRLTIIETGRPPAALQPCYPAYPTMFADLLSPHQDPLIPEVVALTDGQALPDPAGLEAILITGSPAGVYDPEPWIGPLERFIRAAAEVRTPQVGICFGHQIMAQAFGGVVEKSAKGWGVGRHTYEVTADAPWMDETKATRFALAVSHQDQVIRPPETARVIAASAHTEFAALDYTHAPALSFQGHPEMSAAFAGDLVRLRRGVRIPEPVADAALQSLEAPTDHALVAQWIVRFFAQNRKPA